MIFDSIYISLIKRILSEGTPSTDRTSVGSNIKVFGNSFFFDVTENNYMPFMQCRAFSPRIAFEELMWMLRGQTDATILSEKGITIWEGNTTREFLDKNNLFNVPTGNIGKGYGYQMRNFNGVDQLQKIYDSLLNNPTDRRHIINFWNVGELKEMALPPCHYDYQFIPLGNTLNLRFTLRSSDVIFGLAYNIAFAAMWLSFFSRALNFIPGKVMCVAGDVHIYSNQLELAEKIVSNTEILETLHQPRIEINKKLGSLSSILNLNYEDVSIVDWKSGKNPKLSKKVEMAK